MSARGKIFYMPDLEGRRNFPKKSLPGIYINDVFSKKLRSVMEAENISKEMLVEEMEYQQEINSNNNSDMMSTLTKYLSDRESTKVTTRRIPNTATFRLLLDSINYCVAKKELNFDESMFDVKKDGKYKPIDLGYVKCENAREWLALVDWMNKKACCDSDSQLDYELDENHEKQRIAMIQQHITETLKNFSKKNCIAVSCYPNIYAKMEIEVINIVHKFNALNELQKVDIYKYMAKLLESSPMSQENEDTLEIYDEIVDFFEADHLFDIDKESILVEKRIKSYVETCSFEDGWGLYDRIEYVAGFNEHDFNFLKNYISLGCAVKKEMIRCIIDLMYQVNIKESIRCLKTN